MKKVLLPVLLLGAMISSGQSKDEEAIRNVMNEQLIAWNKGDVESFMESYWKSDSLMFIGKSGVTYGWQNTLDNYKRGYPDKTAMGELSFNIIKVEKLTAKNYYIVGKWHLKRSIGDVGGHFTLLFKKIDDRWLIVSDHSS